MKARHDTPIGLKELVDHCKHQTGPYFKYIALYMKQLLELRELNTNQLMDILTEQCRDFQKNQKKPSKKRSK